MRRLGVRASLTLLIPIALSIAPACTPDESVERAKHELFNQIPEGWMTKDIGSTFSIAHPAEWHTEEYMNNNSFSSLLTYVTNQELHDPCKTSHPSPGTTEVRCRHPLDTLGPGGVLIAWYSRGFPGTSFADLPGQEIAIDGHEAKLEVLEGDCGIGADLEIVASIDRENGGNWYEFRACLRGPGLSEIRAAALASLHSFQFEDSDFVLDSSPTASPVTIVAERISDRCSARTAPARIELDEALPDEVIQIAGTIAQSAWACDWNRLVSLADESIAPIDWFSGGWSSSLVRYWRHEDPCDHHARSLIELLDGPPEIVESDDLQPFLREEGIDDTLYAWPRGVGQLGEEDNDYFGFRLGILGSGDWIYFVAGTIRYEGCLR